MNSIGTGVKGLVRRFWVEDGGKLTRFESPSGPYFPLSLDNGTSFEDLDILNGNGEDFFEGLLWRPPLTGDDPTIVQAVGSSITCRDMLVLMTQVRKSDINPYASHLVMNSRTAEALMGVVDSDGASIWDKSNKAAVRLTGIPLVIDEEMPDVAPGAKPVWVGQFSEALFTLEGPNGSAALWHKPWCLVALQIPYESQEGPSE